MPFLLHAQGIAHCCHREEEEEEEEEDDEEYEDEEEGEEEEGGAAGDASGAADGGGAAADAAGSGRDPDDIDADDDEDYTDLSKGTFFCAQVKAYGLPVGPGVPSEVCTHLRWLHLLFLAANLVAVLGPVSLLSVVCKVHNTQLASPDPAQVPDRRPEKQLACMGADGRVHVRVCAGGAVCGAELPAGLCVHALGAQPGPAGAAAERAVCQRGCARAAQGQGQVHAQLHLQRKPLAAHPELQGARRAPPALMRGPQRVLLGPLTTLHCRHGRTVHCQYRLGQSRRGERLTCKLDKLQ